MNEHEIDDPAAKAIGVASEINLMRERDLSFSWKEYDREREAEGTKSVM